MKVLCSALFFFFLSFPLIAQTSASSSVNVTASLIRGLSISNIGGNLAFGEIILTGNAQTPSIAPQNGANFQVTGHPNKNVTITFNPVTLNNNSWAASNGGIAGTILFVPSIENTGTSSSYYSGNVVTSGQTYNLGNISGTGYLYLWAGGSLNIAADQPWGDYTGTLTITVAYP